jgi:hypothetical protein
LGLQPGNYTLSFCVQDKDLTFLKEEYHLINVEKGLILKKIFTYKMIRED